MKAIVIHGPKDLRIEERDAEALGPGEVRVRLASGGICGSDLHYYHHGGFGAVRLKEPMILGHEVSGHIVETGPGVEGLTPGALVAISPSRPCGSCHTCLRGLPNHCLNMRFYGSAMPFPHIQGAFRQDLVALASQCVVADGLTAGQAAMAEPLAVCLHAARRAGELIGRRVLVTGCGPIGALAILVARRAGAVEIVATDLEPAALATARKAGADLALDANGDGDRLAGYAADKGYFDVLLECSGAPAALATGIAALRPRGIIVQVGVGGDMSLPMVAITAKELDLRGSFRFHEEFAVAVAMMRDGLIDVSPLISHTLPMSRAIEAFTLASDRSRAMKVQLEFAQAS